MTSIPDIPPGWKPGKASFISAATGTTMTIMLISDDASRSVTGVGADYASAMRQAVENIDAGDVRKA